MSADWVHLTSEGLSASINPFGAELSSLADAQGNQLLTDGDPAWWSGRAPLLFPIIGELAGGSYRANGRSFALPRHGFARRQPFELVLHKPDHALFRLSDSAEQTHGVYPCFFSLYVEYRLEGSSLTMAATAVNCSDQDIPASFGFHPGFAWPLPYGAAREDHVIRFETDEPAPLKQLDNGLIAIEDRPSPVEGSLLRLNDALFEQDALIWEGLASKKLLYGPLDGPHLEIAWENMPNLGLWTKPGAPYLCIEPWAGIADRADFSGEIWDKPGICRIPPSVAEGWMMRVTLKGV